jgi:hypothetical protein
MKTMLIAACSAIFIFGMAPAREVVVSPPVTPQAATVPIGHRAALLKSVDREGGVLCTSRYFQATGSDASGAVRKSVDCEE